MYAGIIYIARMLLPRLPRPGEQTKRAGSVARIGDQRGLAKERKTYQTNHTGSVARIGHQTGEAKERKTNQTNHTGSVAGSVTREVYGEGEENVPNQPYQGGLAKERKTNQTNHTGSVARIGHQRGLRKRKN